MANKFDTGSYYIKIHDKHGSKQHEEFNIENVIEAKALGEHLSQHDDESYVVLRVIFNSLDDRTNW